MKVIGKWLTETTTDEGLKFFEMMYEMTPAECIKRYELERIAVPEHIKAIVCPEYDGTVNQMFLLEDGDEVFAWSEGCYDTVFNTCGIAFMELVRDDILIAQWTLDNSPYEMNDDDLEEIEFDMSKLPEGITRDQVIFVAQL